MQQNTDVPIPPEIRHQIEDWHELRRLRFHQQAISHNQRVMDHNQRVILEKLTQRSAPGRTNNPLSSTSRSIRRPVGQIAQSGLWRTTAGTVCLSPT